MTDGGQTVSDDSQVNPNTFLLGSGCISALIVTFVGIIGLLIVRSMNAFIFAGVLFWIMVAFRVAWHWDDAGWTREIHRGMVNSFLVFLAGLSIWTVVLGFLRGGFGRDFLIQATVVPTIAAGG